MNYSEKLKDPRWQKKRLEIFQRDNFECQYCHSTSVPLNVHHLEYRKGIEPWEYNNDELLTLCQDCHESEYDDRKNAEEELLHSLRLCKFMCQDLRILDWYISEHLEFKDKINDEFTEEEIKEFNEWKKKQNG